MTIRGLRVLAKACCCLAAAAFAFGYFGEGIAAKLGVDAGLYSASDGFNVGVAFSAAALIAFAWAAWIENWGPLSHDAALQLVRKYGAAMAAGAWNSSAQLPARKARIKEAIRKVAESADTPDELSLLGEGYVWLAEFSEGRYRTSKESLAETEALFQEWQPIAASAMSRIAGGSPG
jgi:hypothetical protein